MGLIEKYRQFKESRREKAILKNLKQIKNAKALKEDRDYAIEFFLAESDPKIAVPALLKRFDYSLEHGINDTREKEKAMTGVISFGESAVPLITDHLQKTIRIAWPIKALKEIVEQTSLVTCLESLLGYGDDIYLDQAKVDKNYDILCYLRDYKLPTDIGLKLGHFLTAKDERVRFAAAEALTEQVDESYVEQLQPFVFDNSTDNIRIRKMVIQMMINQKWKLKPSPNLQPGPLVENVFITKDYQLSISK